MQKKIFIGIQIPDMIKKRLIQATLDWQDLPVKWVPIGNLHSTLLFLGHVSEEEVGEICEKVKEVAQNIESFEILFEKIALAPDEKEPRMFWLKGAENEEMKKLAEKLEQALQNKAAPKKSFRPHVTLGRIRHERWLALLEKPVIEKKLSASVSAEAVEVFESVLERGKSKFIVLESCPLA